MKALSMPISSPSRREKFPPPLVRFLRSNIGSKGRGKSRSTPIFYMRSIRNTAGMIETTQEPSSPKVTCIGQVKSTASKSGGAAVNGRLRHRGRRWWLVKRALFFGKISSIFLCGQKRVFRRIFRKWALLFRTNYCKKVDAEEDCFRVHSNKKSEKTENFGGESEFYSKNYENFDVRIQESEKDCADDCSSPPENALILTRCKSAPPYRFSSLGGIFWSSALADNDEKSEEPQNPRCKNEEENSRISQESSKEFENFMDNGEDLKGNRGGGVHPLLLTRCKSEPAKIGEKLNPEARQTRFG